MNTLDLLFLSLAWAVVSSWGAAYAWTHGPRIIRTIATRISDSEAMRQRITEADAVINAARQLLSDIEPWEFAELNGVNEDDATRLYMQFWHSPAAHRFNLAVSRENRAYLASK